MNAPSRTFLSLAFLSLALTACTSGRGLTAADRDAFREARAEDAHLEIPLIVQEKDHCGPATLTMALRHYDAGVRLEDVTAMTFTPRAQGSFQTDLLAAARRLGFAPYRIPDMAGVYRAVDAGMPVVVFQNLGLSFYPVWHYALVTGYAGGDLLLHTGDQADARVPLERLAKTWDRADRWSYVFVPPEVIPVGATLDEALGNAEVFAREGHPDEAILLYRAIAQEFPRAFEGPAGLGLLAFEAGDVESAIHSFREAVARAPTHPGLRHNLEQVLAQSKKQRVQ